MKIQNLTASILKVPLTNSCAIAYFVNTACHVVLLELTTDEGVKGYGEAAPLLQITGDTPDTILTIFEMLKPRLIGRNPLEYAMIIQEIDRLLAHHAPAKAAIDIALHDLAAKAYHIPLKQLFGGACRDQVVTSLTAWLGTLDETITRVKYLLDHQAKILKVKVGQNLALDIERIKTIRDVFGYEFALRLDANQGYTPKQAISFLEKVAPYQIEFLEQPTPAWDIAGLKYVTDHSDIPIMADETVCSPADAIHVIRERACDLINIKLMKSGGLLRAREIATIAQAAGIGCMLGAMVETKIGMSAATHAAYSHPNMIYADLDGHIDLAEDPTSGGFETRHGCNFVSEMPGIGVEPNPTILQKYLVKSL